MSSPDFANVRALGSLRALHVRRMENYYSVPFKHGNFSQGEAPCGESRIVYCQFVSFLNSNFFEVPTSAGTREMF